MVITKKDNESITKEGWGSKEHCLIIPALICNVSSHILKYYSKKCFKNSHTTLLLYDLVICRKIILEMRRTFSVESSVTSTIKWSSLCIKIYLPLKSHLPTGNELFLKKDFFTLLFSYLKRNTVFNVCAHLFVYVWLRLKFN